MKKNTLVLLIITGILLMLVAVTFWFESRKKAASTSSIQMPAKVVVPTRGVDNYSSETGAFYISPTDSQYVEERLIADLRNKCPITNEAFSLNYDYNKNLFIVTIKNNSDDNNNLFNLWIKSAGYDQISTQYFQKI